MDLLSKNYSLLATRYSLRLATALHLLLFALVVTGVLPREVVPFWAIALVLWTAIVPPKQSVLFFAAAIPTFVAIPITPDFDNFNTWRIIALVIFLRWFLSTQSWRSLAHVVMAFLKRPMNAPVALCLLGLAVLAIASVSQAADTKLALLRIIYFANAALVPIVAFALAAGDRSPSSQWRHRLMRAMGWSAVLVTTIAFIQLASTYVMDIYAFMRIWGEGIQLRQFGTQWSTIAVTMGNTWLAYYGPQLSLRVFSLFTDSHSFPIYLLMALGGVVAFALQPVAGRLKESGIRLRDLLHTRTRMSIVWIPLGLLAVILSGTRGIWAASIGLPLIFLAVAWYLKRTRPEPVPGRRMWWKYLGILIASYYLLFLVAWPVFVSPQFLLSKGDWALLGNRVRSIVDWGETSNAQRLEIWRASVASIREHPLLGVGIGNFPVVLEQHVTLARAGSSAHNVWLHVAAEMGVPALLLFIGIWCAAIASCLRLFARSTDMPTATWSGWVLFVVPWIAAYLLTDAALFDERALLMFGLVIALARGSDSSHDA
jgi:O-antigen ligase